MLLSKISPPYAQNICAPFFEQIVQPVSAREVLINSLS